MRRRGRQRHAFVIPGQRAVRRQPHCLLQSTPPAARRRLGFADQYMTKPIRDQPPRPAAVRDIEMSARRPGPRRSQNSPPNPRNAPARASEPDFALPRPQRPPRRKPRVREHRAGDALHVIGIGHLRQLQHDRRHGRRESLQSRQLPTRYWAIPAIHAETFPASSSSPTSSHTATTFTSAAIHSAGRAPRLARQVHRCIAQRPGDAGGVADEQSRRHRKDLRPHVLDRPRFSPGPSCVAANSSTDTSNSASRTTPTRSGLVSPNAVDDRPDRVAQVIEERAPPPAATPPLRCHDARVEALRACASARPSGG